MEQVNLSVREHWYVVSLKQMVHFFAPSGLKRVESFIRKRRFFMVKGSVGGNRGCVG